MRSSTRPTYDSVHAATTELQRRGWRRAKEVERGYVMTIDDYTNDLAVREWLEAVRPLVTARVQSSLDERLAPVDAQFRAATAVPAKHMPGAGDGWYYRLPRVLVDELAQDAAWMNLIPADVQQRDA